MLPSALISLGRVNGVYGVKGWLKVHSDTSPRENIVAYKNWHLSDSTSPQATTAAVSDESNTQWVELEAGRAQGKNIVAKLQGVDDRDAAQLLVGRTIAVERENLPVLNSDEYYWTDLSGLEVIDSQAQRLGKVSRLFETGANDVMVVKETDGSGGEILIPWILGSVVTQVDLEAKSISVDWDPDY